jgi:hypothetical protein
MKLASHCSHWNGRLRVSFGMRGCQLLLVPPGEAAKADNDELPSPDDGDGDALAPRFEDDEVADDDAPTTVDVPSSATTELTS